MSVLVVARARHRIRLTRTVDPPRVAPGRGATVRLDLVNLSRLPTGVLLAQDQVPYALGTRPRFVVDRLDGGAHATVTYPLRSEVRGRWEIGPLHLRVTDPFGMCEVTRSFSATDPLVVLPRVHRLAPLTDHGRRPGSGDSTSRSAAASGEHDLATREYRHGDDLRRVHWRSTARRGELMVRRDEQPHQLRATVLLDRRAGGHRGEGPASSFEWAVSAAASVGALLVDGGYGVRVLSDDTDSPWNGREHGGGSAPLLDRLATATPGGPDLLAGACARLRRGGDGGLVVAVLGEVTPTDVTPLTTLARRDGAGIAVLLDTTTWTSLPARQVTALAEARHRTAEHLTRCGWTVVTATAHDTVPDTWAAATSRPAARDRTPTGTSR